MSVSCLSRRRLLQRAVVAGGCVTNRLEEIASIHWHGILLPPDMDGVPGVSFAGIKAGETFTYRFPVVRSGTYWAHSHSGGQDEDADGSVPACSPPPTVTT